MNLNIQTLSELYPRINLTNTNRKKVKFSLLMQLLCSSICEHSFLTEIYMASCRYYRMYSSKLHIIYSSFYSLNFFNFCMDKPIIEGFEETQ